MSEMPASTHVTEPDPSALDVQRLEGGLCVMAFQRADRMNALDPYAAAALREALRDAMADPALRVIVLHGAGGHFCTGFDLKHQRVPGGGEVDLPQMPDEILPALLPATTIGKRDLPQWRSQWLIWRAARNPSRIFS